MIGTFMIHRGPKLLVKLAPQTIKMRVLSQKITRREEYRWVIPPPKFHFFITVLYSSGGGIEFMT